MGTSSPCPVAEGDGRCTGGSVQDFLGARVQDVDLCQHKHPTKNLSGVIGTMGSSTLNQERADLLLNLAGPCREERPLLTPQSRPETSSRTCGHTELLCGLSHAAS